MRAFVKLREMLSFHKELATKFAELEHKISAHDENIQELFKAINELMTQPEEENRKIGFRLD